jgi:hypothetical protein
MNLKVLSYKTKTKTKKKKKEEGMTHPPIIMSYEL